MSGKEVDEKLWEAARTHKILLYFHGNAEDIGHSYEFLSTLGEKFHVYIQC